MPKLPPARREPHGRRREPGLLLLQKREARAQVCGEQRAATSRGERRRVRLLEASGRRERRVGRPVPRRRRLCMLRVGAATGGLRRPLGYRGGARLASHLHDSGAAAAVGATARVQGLRDQLCERDGRRRTAAATRSQRSQSYRLSCARQEWHAPGLPCAQACRVRLLEVLFAPSPLLSGRHPRPVPPGPVHCAALPRPARVGRAGSLGLVRLCSLQHLA